MSHLNWDRHDLPGGLVRAAAGRAPNRFLAGEGRLPVATPSGLAVWSVKAMAGETTTLHIVVRVACRLEARLLRKFADN